MGKVKVTEARKCEIPYSHSVKLQLAEEDKSHEVCMQHGVFGCGGLNDVTADCPADTLHHAVTFTFDP